MLSCFDYKPCSLSPPYLTFGRDEGTRTTLKVALRRAPAPAHAWLVDVDGVAGKGVVERRPLTGVVTQSSKSQSSVVMTVDFSGEPPEYCVDVRFESLVDQSVLTERVCALATGVDVTSGLTLDDYLTQCDEPPTEDLKGRWCALRADDPQCPKPSARDGGCACAAPGQQPPTRAVVLGFLALAGVAFARALASRRRRRPATA